MQHLLLKAAEYCLDGLRLAIVRLRGSMHVAKFLKESVCIQLLMSALVVVNNLVRLVFAGLNGHAVGVILCLVVLRVADVPAKHYLAHRINDYIDLCCAYLTILVLVVEVELRSVTIPQRIALRRQRRSMLPSILLPCSLFAIHGIIP